MLYVILIFFLFICITKVKFRVINILNDTDVYVKIGLIKIHMDYDMFVKGINKIYKDQKINYTELKKNIGYYNIIKNIVNNSNVNIRKMNVVKKNNLYNIFNIYLNTTYYTITSFIKNFLLVNTKQHNNISFLVIPSKEEDIDIDIDIEFSLVLFLKSCLLNIKNLIKIKKEMI